MRVITKDAFVRPESVQTLVDLVRESTNVMPPVAAAEVSSILAFWKRCKSSWD